MYLQSNFQNTEHALSSVHYRYCPDQNMNFEKKYLRNIQEMENSDSSFALIIRHLSLPSWTLGLTKT